jgi:hypothetical protein
MGSPTPSIVRIGEFAELQRACFTYEGRRALRIVVRVARYPPEGNLNQLPRTALRDKASSRRDKQMRTIASFIIHYQGLESGKEA